MWWDVHYSKLLSTARKSYLPILLIIRLAYGEIKNRKIARNNRVYSENMCISCSLGDLNLLSRSS